MSENINITFSIDVPVDFVKEVRNERSDVPKKAVTDADKWQNLIDEIISAFKESDEQTRKNTKDFREFFEDLEEIAKPLCQGGYKTSISPNLDYKAEEGQSFDVGDEVYYIQDGTACKGTIKNIRFQVDNNLYFVNRVFHSMDELVEYLKENVHG